MCADATHSVHLANHLKIGDLPSDILLLILSSLHGQHIAGCIPVCRRFAGLIRFDLRLQYKIELAQSGMADSNSSTLPTSERLRRLLQYSSKFRNGVFDRGEDPTEYTDHMLSETHDLRVSSRRISYHESSFPVFHLEFDRPAGHFLSVFTQGSGQAGIQPRRWLIPLGNSEQYFRTKRAVDDAQDLLVIAGAAVPLAGGLERVIEINFFSLERSKTTMAAHPAASRPCIQVRPDTVSEVMEPMVLQLAISGQYAMWVFSNPQGEVANYAVEVYNWMTGQVISRIDVGPWPVHVIPLDHPYLLVLPDVWPYPDIRIYTFAASAQPSSRICTLRLPNLDPAQHVLWHHICTSRRPPPSEGSFRTDPAHWMITFVLRSNLGRQRLTTYLLIPRATLSAHIRAAEARDVVSELSVPWQDWGSRGCLRLRLCRTPFRCILRLVPFGSRMPFVAFEPSSFQSGSVYVFDLNPLAARRERHQAVLSSHWQCGGLGSEFRTTAVVEDVEEALPGVVDPECSAIPYVVYRFDLADVLGITAVVMGMTGFMVLVSTWVCCHLFSTSDRRFLAEL
ncbi:hypothetical protein V8D89_003499 [Ganoderma adspersum]